MSAWILMSLCLLVASVAGGTAQDRQDPTPSKAEREAIVAAANQAIRTYLKGDPKLRRGDEIPRESWGEAILRLKPLRVRNDRVNVAIVLRDEDGVEEGPKKPKPKKQSGARSKHVATAKILERVIHVQCRLRGRERSARREPDPAAPPS